MTTQEALLILLERYPLRPAYRRTQPGKGDPDIIKRNLATAYVAYRRQEHTDGDISCVVPRAKRPRMKIVRQA